MKKNILIIAKDIVFATELHYDAAVAALIAANKDVRLKDYSMSITNTYSTIGWSLIGKKRSEIKKFLRCVRKNDHSILLTFDAPESKPHEKEKEVSKFGNRACMSEAKHCRDRSDKACACGGHNCGNPKKSKSHNATKKKLEIRDGRKQKETSNTR